MPTTEVPTHPTAISESRLSRLGLLQEPLGYEDGMNRSEFVAGNPINRRDPSGLLCDSVAQIKITPFDQTPDSMDARDDLVDSLGSIEKLDLLTKVITAGVTVTSAGRLLYGGSDEEVIQAIEELNDGVVTNGSDVVAGMALSPDTEKLAKQLLSLGDKISAEGIVGGGWSIYWRLIPSAAVGDKKRMGLFNWVEITHGGEKGVGDFETRLEAIKYIHNHLIPRIKDEMAGRRFSVSW